MALMLALGSLSLCGPAAWAQSPAPLAVPNLSLVRNGGIGVMAQHPDGGVIVASGFTSIDGQTRDGLARLNPDGSLDGSWVVPVTGSISALAVDGTGRIYVGGLFSRIAGQPRQRLARLQADGSLDAGWTPVVNGGVSALAVGAGSVYVVGSFSQIGGTPRAGLARVSEAGAGAVDTDWDPAPDGPVFQLLLDADGAVFARGGFGTIGGLARAGLARLDGSGSGAADALWNPQPNNAVFAMARHGSALFVGGNFSSIGGQARSNIARLSTTGSGAADAVWNAAPNNPVTVIATDATGAVYIDGSMSSVNGQPRSFVARLAGSGAGTLDAGFVPDANGQAGAILATSTGQVLVGGSFSRVNGEPTAGFVALDGSAALRPVARPEMPGTVRALARQSNGDLLIGGDFLFVDGEPRGHLARIRSDGSLDSGFDPVFDGAVNALALAADDSVLVGGQFSQVDGIARAHLARLSDAGDVDAGWQASSNGPVFALALENDALFVGGAFSSIGGQPRGAVARLSLASGTVDAGWNASLASGNVRALALDGEGALYVGGSFASIGGQARANLARVASGGSGAVVAGWSADTNNVVLALTLADNGALFAGGVFTSIGGLARNRLAKVDAGGSGAVDAGWDADVNQLVSSLASDLSGALYVGGQFGAVGGQSRARIAKLRTSGSGAVDAAWNPVASGHVTALLPDGLGTVYAAGEFVTLGGQPRAALGRLPSFHTLSYSADANGSISGQAQQLAHHGHGGTAVTAVPDAGFRFVQWSDGSTANPRTETSVVAPLAVSASFANGAPVIQSVQASPAVLFEAESSTISIAASDLEPGALLHAFDCDGDGSFEIGPQTQAVATCTFPTPGTRTVNVRVSDVLGVTDSAALSVTVNDSVPFASLAPAVTVDEDAALALAASAGVPSSGESIDRVEADCAFDGVAFDADISAVDASTLACPGYPTPGPRRIALRAFDNEGESSGIVTADIAVLAINDAPQFVAGADVTVNEDAPAVALAGWATQIAAGPPEATDEAVQLLQFEMLANSQPALFSEPPQVDPDGRLHFTAAADANGVASLSLRLCDDGASSPPNRHCSEPHALQIRIESVNDAPTLVVGNVPIEPPASSGPRTIPGFAAFDAGPDDEDALQTVSAYLVDAVLDPDGVIAAGSIAVSLEGTLTYTLTGASGSAAVALRVRDSGGTALGGQDVSATALFTVRVGAGADLQVAIDNGRQQLVDAETTLYAIVVANAGPNPVAGARLTDVLPPTLIDAQWTCVPALSTASCPSSGAGEGDLDVLIDLAVDRFLRFDLIAEVDAGQGAFAVNIVEVALPDGVAAIDAGNDRAIDQDPIFPIAIHADGFETDGGDTLTVPGAREALRR